MGKHKKSHEKFITYKDADKLFKKGALLLALQDGAVVAYGTYRETHEQDVSGERVHINPYCWLNYYFDGVDNLSTLGNHEGSNDPYGFTNIIIEKSSIDGFKSFSNQGRPPKYDWDCFWRDMAYFLYAAKNDDIEIVLKSLRDWAKNAPEDHKYVWKNTGAPSETALEEKMRPLIRAIEQKSRYPLREALKKIEIK